MAFKSILLAGCASFLFSTNSHAYFIELEAHASAGDRPAPFQDNFSATDTVTSWSVNTGLIGPNPPTFPTGKAQASASADLSTGQIKSYVYAEYGGEASTYAGMREVRLLAPLLRIAGAFSLQHSVSGMTRLQRQG